MPPSPAVPVMVPAFLRLDFKVDFEGVDGGISLGHSARADGGLSNFLVMVKVWELLLRCIRDSPTVAA